MAGSPGSSPFSNNHLRFLLTSSIENLVRLERILDRYTESGASQEYHAITAGMLDWCRRYREEYFPHTDTIRHLLVDSSPSEVQQLALKTLLRNCINTFLILHDLLLFLPRESIRKELVFFLQSLLDQHYSKGEISVVLTSLYNAFEYSLDEHVKSRAFLSKMPDPSKLKFGSVLELAIIDRDNPFSWAVLAHEFGHYIDDKLNISDPVAAQFLKSNLPNILGAKEERIFKDLAAEIFCDLMAFHLLGPVGILPILNMELNLGMRSNRPAQFDKKHPFAITRLSIIDELSKSSGMDLDWFSGYIEALIEDEKTKTAILLPGEKVERDRIHSYVNRFAGEIRSPLTDALLGLNLPKFTSENFKKSQKLKADFQDGIPISASREHTESQVEDALAGLPSNPSVDQARSVLRMLQEKPVMVSEVVTSAWMAKSEGKTNLFRKAFDQTDSAGVFYCVGKVVEEQDALLMRSIEAVSILGKRKE